MLLVSFIQPFVRPRDVGLPRLTRLTRLTGGRRCEQPGSHGPTPGVGGSKRRWGHRVVGTGATSVGTDGRRPAAGRDTAESRRGRDDGTTVHMRMDGPDHSRAGRRADVRRSVAGRLEAQSESKPRETFLRSSYTLTSTRTRRVANIRIQGQSVSQRVSRIDYR